MKQVTMTERESPPNKKGEKCNNKKTGGGCLSFLDNYVPARLCTTCLLGFSFAH